MEIVLLRLDRIGDFILGSPSYRALRQAYPTDRITAVVPSDVAELANACPYFDAVHIHDALWLLSHRRPAEWWMSAWRLIRFLRSKKPGWVLDFRYQNRLDPIVAGLSGAKRRTGYDLGLASLFLNERVERPGPQLHQVERNLYLLRSAGVAAESCELEVWWDGHDRTTAEERMPTDALRPGAPRIAVHVGAGLPAKRWPEKRFGALIHELRALTQADILVMGGEKDVAVAAAVVNHVECPVINLAGKLSLRQMAALVGSCQVFIGCDSGATHVAAAVGVPVVSLFSAANRVEVWRPWGPKVTVITRHPTCSPCHSFQCTRNDGYFCMADIAVDEVAAAVRTAWTER